MIKFIKSLFSPAKPGEGMLPIKADDDKFEIEEELKNIEEEMKEEREWIYIGDGMMEEVIRRGDPFPKANPCPGAKVLKAKELKNAVQASRARSSNTSYSDPVPMSVAVYAATSGGYDSGYSSTCDSSSPSCD